MALEWAEQKRQTNLAKHGIDFEAAKLIFGGSTIDYPDVRREYGEQRVGAYGEVSGVVMFIVYTRRGDIRRLISARKAGTLEREFHYSTRAAGGADDER